MEDLDLEEISTTMNDWMVSWKLNIFGGISCDIPRASYSQYVGSVSMILVHLYCVINNITINVYPNQIMLWE